jgi:MFS family permease
LLLASVPIWLHKEAPRPAPGPALATGESPRALFSAFTDLWRRPGMKSWLLVLVLYKGADALATGMLRPFFVDVGLSMGDIGWLLGGVGFSTGLVGALLGGRLIVPMGRRRALLLFGVIQCLAVGGYLLPALGVVHMAGLVVLVGAEHLTGGMATAALFTLMMDRSRSESAGTDYTVQASVVVIASGGAAALSGVVAASLGYALHFALSMGLGLIGLWVIHRWLLSEELVIEGGTS